MKKALIEFRSSLSRISIGVSAVRDLFGTVQNEGASKDILITTSGYKANKYSQVTSIFMKKKARRRGKVTEDLSYLASLSVPT